MSSVISPCYIHDTNTYRRHIRYLRYMQKHIQDRLGYNRIVLFDNASDMKFLVKLGATIYDENFQLLQVGSSTLYVIRFNEHLPRIGHLGYSYIWRFLYKIPELHKNPFFQSDKYYHIDTDNFIQTNELIDYLKSIKEGFVSLYDYKHNFPESAMFILHSSSINILKEQQKYGIFREVEAEWALPFTHVEKRFYGGRFGETKIEDPRAHWIGQAVRTTKVKFRG